MKKGNRFFRVMSFIMVIAMVLSMMPASIFAVEGTTLYLKPNANWLKDGARFAMYCFGNGETWVDMTDANKDGVYEVVVPEGFSNIIFCRMNPGAADNNWNNKWNQTADLTVPTDGTNCYTVKEGTWDQGGGTWSKLALTFGVSYQLTNVTSSNTAATIEEGTAYSTTLKAKAAYALPESVSVTVGGTALTGGYTYDSKTGALTVDAASVTGDLVITAAADAYTYLKPNANWAKDGARFAVYTWDIGDFWADLTDEDGDGYYEVVLPEGVSNLIFCRMSPTATANNWNNKWNQSSDLKLPTDGKNCYTVAEGAWDKGAGTWSVYTPEEEEEGGEEEPEVPEATYILAGSGMFGTDWDPSNTANKMSRNADGLYEKVYENVPAGTYEFKVTDGTWNNSWGVGTGNYSFTLTEVSKVTILFNETTKAIEVKTEAVPDAPEATYILAGSGMFGTDWDPSNTANKMSRNADGLYEKVYENVPAGTYEFKVTDGTWNNSWGNGTGNYSFTLTEESKVTILFDEITKAIEVKHEAVAKLSTDYYLAGYLNNADYEGTNYQFDKSGKLTVTFTADSYVYIKNAQGDKYFFASYCQATTGTLLKGKSEKMFVPGGIELTFTLVENADGTLTLSYEKGASETPDDAEYYLVGYLNNADYEGTDYKFVDGKLTVTFTADSYVYIKDNQSGNYMFATYCQDVTGTLAKGNTEKMFVPANTELNFTLVDNGDGTLTLSYSVAVEVPEVPEGYNTVTIHFLKPAAWGSKINAWVWDANGAIPGYELYNTAWPGSAIPGNANKDGWYDLVIGTKEPQSFNFIFNDGSSQTADLTTGAITGPTELWVVDGNVYATAPMEWTHYTATIHFQKPADWGDTVSAYAWTDTDVKLLGEWPGTVAPASVNTGWHTAIIKVEIGRTLNFIFNNNNNGKQTADLTAGKLTGNVELWIDGSGNTVAAPAGWIDANRTVHVPGTFPGPSWDPASNEMTYDPTLGLYVITFKNVTPGTYYYKIAINGSWAENYGEGGVASGTDISVAVPTAQDVTIWYSDVSHRSVCSVNYDINAAVTLTGTGIPEGTKMVDPNLTGLFSTTVKLAPGKYSDVTITFGDYTFTFGEFELENEKEVTFYFDPSTYLAYHNASDKKVETDKIFFDTKDLEFKDPFGAVATGADVTFTIETGTDATQASLVVKGRKAISMEKDGEAEDGVQRWTCTTKFDNAGEYQYYFAITNGSDMVFYTDDNYNNYYKKGDYGTGTVRDINNLFPYDLVVYYAGYTTPDWMKNAVIYQIFPDRFFDGDETNNQAQLDARGSVSYEYVSDWYLLPENPEQPDAPVYVFKGDGEWSNEIYGGDLEGITQRIGYLKALGVNVIYLNPVFSSISNHRYDACDYMQIDPILGTLGDFEELVAVAEANGMKIILDGVFNHVSDDSVYFDRYYKFLGTSEKIGAYPYWAYVYDYMAEKSVSQADAEAVAKTYFSANYGITDYSYTEWFAVNNVQGTGVDKIGLRAGKPVYTYEGWWGYDSMPVIKSTNGSEYQTGNWAEEIIRNENASSVTQYWITKGNDGWRLDVANEVSDETWVHFRNSVKALNSDAVIIGEIWADATHYLMGSMYDSVMNYVFRDAVAGFARGYLINRDNKAEKWDSDYTAEDAITTLEILRERYPEEAFYAMMNLVASHDTSRILSYLDDVEDDRYQKDQASAFPLYSTTSDRAKQLQYVVSFIQFTYAGAPTIYYGDEIGMVGGDDPDDRRAFEWGKGNQQLVEWYATLAAIRSQYPALRTGDVEAFAPSRDVMGYVRSDKNDQLIVLANRAPSQATVELDLVELGLVNENAKAAVTLTDLVTGKTYTAEGTKVTVSVDAYRGVILTQNVKGYSVNKGALAPAYDASYVVPARSATAPKGTYNTQNGQKVTIGNSLSFTVDAVVNTFVGVSVNGEQLDPEDYEVQVGTVITLTPKCIEELGVGEHTISIEFEGGTATAKFTVVKAGGNVPGSGDNSPTGDISRIGVWVAVLGVSMAAVVVLLILGLKKKKKA